VCTFSYLVTHQTDNNEQCKMLTNASMYHNNCPAVNLTCQINTIWSFGINADTGQTMVIE